MTEPLGISVTLDVEMDRFRKSMQDAGRLVEGSTKEMDRAAKRAAQGFGRLEAALDPAARAAQRLQRDTEKVQSAVQRGVVTNERAAQVQRRLNDQYERATLKLRAAEGATEAFASANRAAAASAGRFGPAIQNVGFQVGDFATQVASGQNALVAFTQQGTQVAGAFGPWGAVIGAAGAVVGALGVSLMRTRDAMADSIDTEAAYQASLEATVERLSEVNGLTRERMALLAVEQRNEVNQARRDVAAAEGELRAARERLSNMSIMDDSEGFYPRMDPATRAVMEDRLGIPALRDEIAALEQNAQLARGALEGMLSVDDPVEDITANLAEIADAVDREFATIRDGYDTTTAAGERAVDALVDWIHAANDLSLSPAEQQLAALDRQYQNLLETLEDGGAGPVEINRAAEAYRRQRQAIQEAADEVERLSQVSAGLATVSDAAPVFEFDGSTVADPAVHEAIERILA